MPTNVQATIVFPDPAPWATTTAAATATPAPVRTVRIPINIQTALVVALLLMALAILLLIAATSYNEPHRVVIVPPQVPGTPVDPSPSGPATSIKMEKLEVTIPKGQALDFSIKATTNTSGNDGGEKPAASYRPSYYRGRPNPWAGVPEYQPCDPAIRFPKERPESWDGAGDIPIVPADYRPVGSDQEGKVRKPTEVEMLFDRFPDAF